VLLLLSLWSVVLVVVEPGLCHVVCSGKSHWSDSGTAQPMKSEKERRLIQFCLFIYLLFIYAVRSIYFIFY
jgi:hypothetical protein